MSLALRWSETCVITSMEKRILVAGQPNKGDSPESAAFRITDCKLCVAVVTLESNGINIDQKCLIRLKITVKII